MAALAGLPGPACLVPWGTGCPRQAAGSATATLAGPGTPSCCVSRGRPCESALPPCSRPQPRPLPWRLPFTAMLVPTTAGCRGGPWLPVAPGPWPKLRQQATVYKSPLAAPSGKLELAGRDAAVTEGAPGAGAGSCRAAGDVGAAGPGPAPALPRSWQPRRRVLPRPQGAGAEPESEDAVTGFCLLSACPSSVGRMGPLLPPARHRCFPEPRAACAAPPGRSILPPAWCEEDACRGCRGVTAVRPSPPPPFLVVCRERGIQQQLFLPGPSGPSAGRRHR